MSVAHGIQIFPSEASHFDELNTVVLKNGNYLFILGLYHNLHCLVGFETWHKSLPLSRNILCLENSTMKMVMIIVFSRNRMNDKVYEWIAKQRLISETDPSNAPSGSLLPEHDDRAKTARSRTYR